RSPASAAGCRARRSTARPAGTPRSPRSARAPGAGRRRTPLQGMSPRRQNEALKSGFERERQHPVGLRDLVAPDGVDLLPLPFYSASPSALQLVERVRCGLEVPAHLVHLVDEAVPLLLEALEQLEDLVRGAAHLAVVDRLPE